MGHVVRIPVSVNFKAVLAPTVVAPVANLSTFAYDYGIRTPGPSHINVRSTPLQAADVIEVLFNKTDFEYTAIILPEGGFDFFALGLFPGDQPALLDITLIDIQGKIVAGPTRLDSRFTSFLEAKGLAEGIYFVLLRAFQIYYPIFTAKLNVWGLSYQETPDPQGLMQVTLNPVAVDSDGVGSLSLSFDGLSVPDYNPEQPPTRCVGSIQCPGVLLLCKHRVVTLLSPCCHPVELPTF